MKEVTEPISVGYTWQEPCEPWWDGGRFRSDCWRYSYFRFREEITSRSKFASQERAEKAGQNWVAFWRENPDFVAVKRATSDKNEWNARNKLFA